MMGVFLFLMGLIALTVMAFATHWSVGIMMLFVLLGVLADD